MYQEQESPIGSRGNKNSRKDGSEKGIKNKIIVNFTDENGKKQRISHSTIDEATALDAINAIIDQLNSRR